MPRGRDLDEPQLGELLGQRPQLHHQLGVRLGFQFWVSSDRVRGVRVDEHRARLVATSSRPRRIAISSAMLFVPPEILGQLACLPPSISRRPGRPGRGCPCTRRPSTRGSRSRAGGHRARRRALGACLRSFPERAPAANSSGCPRAPSGCGPRPGRLGPSRACRRSPPAVGVLDQGPGGVDLGPDSASRRRYGIQAWRVISRRPHRTSTGDQKMVRIRHGWLVLHSHLVSALERARRTRRRPGHWRETAAKPAISRPRSRREARRARRGSPIAAVAAGRTRTPVTSRSCRSTPRSCSPQLRQLQKSALWKKFAEPMMMKATRRPSSPSSRQVRLRSDDAVQSISMASRASVGQARRRDVVHGPRRPR